MNCTVDDSFQGVARDMLWKQAGNPDPFRQFSHLVVHAVMVAVEQPL